MLLSDVVDLKIDYTQIKEEILDCLKISNY